MGVPLRVQSAQKSIVSRRAFWGSTIAGACSWLGCQVSTNGTLSPARTVNSETVAQSCPCVGAGVRSRMASGPATAIICPAWRRTHGTTWPSSKRSRSVERTATLRLRFDYGQVVPWVRHHSGQMIAVAGPDAIRLRTPAPTHGQDWATVSEFTVRAGDSVPFVLTWHPSHEHAPAIVDPQKALRETIDFWADWTRSGTPITGPYRAAITRSLVTLKALSYEPTGGIVAAVTTSLPEQIGGPRNWDYRYSWLRDSTYTLQALISAGYLAEARAWREWLLRAIAGNPAKLQIMYALDGTRRLPEAELPWLAGYEGSR